MIDPEQEETLMIGMLIVLYLSVFFYGGKIFGFIQGASFAIDYAWNMRQLL